MPLYEIMNIETDDVHEVLMPYSSLQEYLKENANYRLLVCSPAIVSGVSGITHKVDSGFNDVLNRIGNANPYSPMGALYGDKGIKQTKNREVVSKHQTIQSNK